MNRVYKVIWSKAKHCYVVTSEIARSVTKSASSARSAGRKGAAVLAMAALLFTAGGVLGEAANVTDVAAGSAANVIMVTKDGGEPTPITINNVAHATEADYAFKATSDGKGEVIHNTYVKIANAKVSTDGEYVKVANTVGKNLSALDTQVKKNTEAVAGVVKEGEKVGEKLLDLDTQVKANADAVAAEATARKAADQNNLKVGDDGVISKVSNDGTTPSAVKTLVLKVDGDNQITMDEKGIKVGLNSGVMDKDGFYAGGDDYEHAGAALKWDGSIKGAGGKFTVDKDGNADIGGDLTVDKNLTVNGTFDSKTLSSTLGENNYTTITGGKTQSMNLKVDAVGTETKASSSTFDENGSSVWAKDDESIGKSSMTADKISQSLSDKGDNPPNAASRVLSQNKDNKYEINDSVVEGNQSNVENRTADTTDSQISLKDDSGKVLNKSYITQNLENIQQGIQNGAKSSTVNQTETGIKSTATDGKNTASTNLSNGGFNTYATDGTNKTYTKQTATDIKNTAKNGTISNSAQNLVNTASENMTNTVGKDLTTTVGGEMKTTVTGDSSLTAENIKNEAKNRITNTALDVETDASSSIVNKVSNDAGSNTSTQLSYETKEEMSAGGKTASYLRGAAEEKSQLTDGDKKTTIDTIAEQTNTNITDGTNTSNNLQKADQVASSVTDGTNTTVVNQNAGSLASSITDGTKVNNTNNTVDKSEQQIRASDTQFSATSKTATKMEDALVSGGSVIDIMKNLDDAANPFIGSAVTDGTNITVVTQTAKDITNTAEKGTIANNAKDITNNATENMTNTVGKNLETTVGGEMKTTVTGNVTEDFKADLSTKVGGDETHAVTGNQTTTVSGNRTVNVKGTETENFNAQVTNVKTDQKTSVGGNQTNIVTGNQQNTVSGSKTETVKKAVTEKYGSQATTVDGDQSTNVGGNQSNVVKGNQTNTISGNKTETVKGEVTEKYGSLTTEVKGESKLSAANITNSAKEKLSNSAADIGNIASKSITDKVGDNVERTMTTEQIQDKVGKTTVTTTDGLTKLTDEDHNHTTEMDYANVTKDLSVERNTTLGKEGEDTNLTVNSKSEFKDTVKMDSTLEVDGESTFNNKVTITKGGLDVTGGTTTDTLNVTGETRTGTLHVNGGGYVGGDLNVKGNIETHDAVLSADSRQVVTGRQLYQTNERVDRLDNRIKKVGANAAALAALRPGDFNPDDKFSIAAGFGSYRNANAAALGLFYRPNENVLLSLGTSFGDGENMVNAGVSVKFGRGKSMAERRKEMAEEVSVMRDEMKNQNDRIAELEEMLKKQSELIEKLSKES